ncbi:hypothetical protein ANANG_G00171560 [Anguilla anguilla]|uniref:Leucine-rich repeat and coiled-coil domain-containing protein 1 n=1 Tax=Anguilla anguilla TaxID=7936 RepID=A0A9D3M3J2_ANGAN|nr:hypothetical protein ANANG_G00171560 [Anguilla anguilla]
MADGELCLIDKNIKSLLEVPLSVNVRSLNLHCNRISKIEGLTTTWQLRHLDLSSNQIARIEGLDSLSSLRTLNLSCNLITKIEGLTGLVNLIRLNLSYNQISDLTGLLYLHGKEYKLKHLNLQSNRLNNLKQLLQCMVGLKSLNDVILSMDGSSNPVCATPGYREMVLQSLPQVTALDGVDRLGNAVPLMDDCPVDVPGLEDFVEFLLSSDASVSAEKPNSDTALTTPRIDEVLAQFRERVGGRARPRWKREGERRPAKHAPDPEPGAAAVSALHTGSQQLHPHPWPHPRAEGEAGHRPHLGERGGQREGETASGGRRSRLPTRRVVAETAGRRPAKDPKGRRSDSDLETTTTGESAKKAASPRRKAVSRGPTQHVETGATARKGLKTSTRAPTFKTTSHIEEETLKALLLKERAERAELQERERAAQEDLKLARSREDQQQRALRSLEDSVSRAEAQRARHQAEEMKRSQELENKASALRREVEILRASARQYKDKLQQLHELLASREQVHRKELESRLAPGGPEFQESLRREVAVVEERHAQQRAELEEKMAAAKKQYAELEDEFRMALTIEATRFAELKEGFEHPPPPPPQLKEGW